jgi:UDPglucose--hexose-1-phosphate uridylyltransferase
MAGAIRYEAPPPVATGTAPWATRSVENRYPVLRPDASPVTGAGACDHLRGAHEVIVETPRHDHDLTAMTPAELRAAVTVYRDRQAALEERWGWATLFRNRSGQAGASLVHPHAQIVAAERAPPPVRAREARAGAYLARHGRTYVGDAIARARRAGEGGAGRIVVLDRGDGFVALVPHAAEVPLEVWLAPERPEASFGALGDGAELGAFADALGLLLRGLGACTGAASYNFAIVSASRASHTSRAAGPAWHWYLRLRPRLGQPGGFEVATGVAVNPSLPEHDALRLREAVGRVAP